MEKLKISGAQSDSTLLIGESFKNFKNYLPNKQVIVLIDDKVRSLYGSYFEGYSIIEIGQTEKIKTLSTIEFILEQLLNLNADRSTFLLAVGGGIVCDIAGFAASIYLRGIDFGFISTTLLAQVDASVGGKNGVNFHGFKNMVGVFNQPSFVLCDQVMLKTLSPDDLNCGFAEIVKHTLIADAEMFAFLEQNVEKALNIDPVFIEALVSNSVKIKAGIVNRDEKEKGERRKLNLGHTYGHAVEKVMGISHGNAVSIGLAIAANLSLKRNTITQNEYNRIINLLKALNLPVSIHEKHQEILEALFMDKKREGNQIHFVLMQGIGKVSLELITIDELRKINL
jgi:3-dehydroquinate synthase